jgi:pyruvate/2-oxoglutarate dehydrogenase complex dihydrolipoamide acyltransferase (E2) component
VSSKSKEQPDFCNLGAARCRWNLLDLIQMVGRESIPTYLFYDVDMTWVENLRKQFAAVGYKTTVTAILLKAIAIAQRAHPITRTTLLPTGKLVTLNSICAGFTVERFVKGQPAVFFGSIKEPDVKPLIEISDELRSYATDAIETHEVLETQNWFNNVPWLLRQIILFVGMRVPSIRIRYMGATFGLSSLGKFGCKVVVPPCVSTSTFGIGEVEERPVAVNGKVEVRPVLSLVLNFDHRVIDGAPAARFMQDVIELLQGGLEEYVLDELAKLATKAKPLSQSAAFVSSQA